ncbi:MULTISPECIES: tRNA-uridine aminocarboxypropyltransferase [Vibrio]|jgi:DTW domain-containing protein YfiP|uniref:tRNA-uridine aminocarboxypropyltransferase n=1 Tax=Vibrio TaxID=662 RepID=UPI00028EE9FE|nr:MULTISPECIES: tRNA-uridine aminocarboxypropyltransferase [Vibrio harveyi group]EKM15152.1 DTW domain protein [Vibrio harveyi]EKO3785634.1 DTW domain-containing protein [Vibrio harveyi]EKO3801424.1 DTW domain-containing protein [Vibrio harveyi]EKO3815245.1 DTW domain-containing protein [Vibrio harveyi]EKO3851090.1 DTW domain-containing protein [Vibrio harveyi]
MRIHAFHRLYQHRQSISTKPFNARGCKVVRCPYCQVSEQYCLCEIQPNIESNIACMLIVSENEVFKPSNTGRLIADTIQETYVYQWNRTEPSEEMLALLENDAYQPVVVFPADYVDEPERLLDGLNPERLKTSDGSDKKWLMIFIDGSWREARKIFRRSEFLKSLPVLSIEPESLSEYIMRRSDNEQHLSTAEVATLVFKQAGEEQASECLQLWFEAFRETYMLTKTRVKTDWSRPHLKRFKEWAKIES